MIFLRWNSATGPDKIVLVFGSGLVGHSIIHQLEWNGYVAVGQFETSWTAPELLRQQFRRISDFAAQADTAGNAELHLVWSAGTGGFASAEQDLEHEQEGFRCAVDLFSEFRASQPAVFHFISSAGGLFEGQVLVDEDSRAAPRRPYGKMKLRQEALVGAQHDGDIRRVRIYRPSTVYGVHEFDHRSGLVSHLCWNALRNFPTVLEANIHALRDYVYVNDMGRYLARQIQAGLADQRQLYYLVSGKPSSIFEIRQRIEKLVGRSVLFQFSSNNNGGSRSNDKDITFSRQMLPTDWSPVDLDYGLRAVLRKTNDAYLENTVI